MTHPKLYEADPFRPLNWREERVISLLEAPGGARRASTRFDDEYVRKYRSFLIRWKASSAEDVRMRLFVKFPDLYHAQRLREHPSGESQAVLEARILSGASNAEIAHNFGTAPGVIRWYEKLFYNVRDRLDRIDYIRDMVLVPMLERAVAYDDREVITAEKRHAIYRMMAYVGGPRVLDFMLLGFKRVPHPSRMTQLDDWLDSAFNSLARQKGLFAMQAFSFNKYTVMQLLEMCRSVVDSAEEAKRSGGGATTEFHANVQAFLEQINIGVGKAMIAKDEPKVLEFESGAIEPRADDYAPLAEGETPEDLAVYSGFSRPEPRPKE